MFLWQFWQCKKKSKFTFSDHELVFLCYWRFFETYIFVCKKRKRGRQCLLITKKTLLVLQDIHLYLYIYTSKGTVVYCSDVASKFWLQNFSWTWKWFSAFEIRKTAFRNLKKIICFRHFQLLGWIGKDISAFADFFQLKSL